MMERVFKGYGGALISVAVMLSTFGTVNATSMTTARVYFAMAKDRIFFRSMGNVHPKFRTPGKSLIVQGIWASILTLSGNYDQLYTYLIFASWIFYALGAAGVFILRRKFPNPNRSYTVPGFPVIPILFVGTATWFVLNTLVNQPADSLVGLFLLALGIPFYLYWRARIEPVRMTA
jgi:APA family basic amino acid/polyamine antiporter